MERIIRSFRLVGQSYRILGWATLVAAAGLLAWAGAGVFALIVFFGGAIFLMAFLAIRN